MFSLSDLTIVIPTLGRDPEVLKELLSRIPGEVKTLVIWDSSNPPPGDFLNLAHGAKAEIVSHQRNRGLSAARNTGVAHTRTSLCMFVDDDIIPDKDFAEKVVEFHSLNRDMLNAMIGCVTWRGGKYSSPLTEWFENRTAWSQFHTIQANQNFTFFAGGFTSFKTEAFEQLRFDESFLRYGCEDVEFGYRFFRRGGRLTYRPDMLGIHMKPFSLAALHHDNLGAGYSYGRMLDLHPDVGADVDQIIRTINTTLAPDKLQALISIANGLIKNNNNLVHDDQCDAMIRIITQQSQQQGLLDYLVEHYPDFLTARDDAVNDAPRSPEALMNSVQDYAIFLHALAVTESDPNRQYELISQAAAANDHYAAPYLLALERGLPDQPTARQALAAFFAKHGEHLDLSTYQRIRLSLALAPDETPAQASSARDLYLQLLQESPNQGPEERIALVHAILNRDISHVGARIAWAEAISASAPQLARILLAEATYFLRNRPAREQKSTRQRIDALINRL